MPTPTNPTLPRRTLDWNLDSCCRRPGHRLNPWLKKLDMRQFRRDVIADTHNEIDDAIGEPPPIQVWLDARPIRHQVESLEIDEGNAEAWDEGNPDLRLTAHSPNSVTCEDEFVEWGHYENDWNEKRKPRYYQSRHVPRIRGFRVVNGKEVSYG